MKKKIKIIDLLNKIVNGEETPRLIRINGFNFRFISYVSVDCFYAEEETSKYWFDFMSIDLNDEVEILDEEDEFEDIKEIIGEVEKDETLTFDEIREGIIENFNLVIRKTNSLIKNQKKIIKRLNSLDNN